MYKVLDVDVDVDLEVCGAIPNAAVLELLLRIIVNGSRNIFLAIMIPMLTVDGRCSDE